MKKHDKNGYALVVVLALSLALFTLVSLALTANHRLHRHSRLIAQRLQVRARNIIVE